MSSDKIVDFILDSQYEDFDENVILGAKKCLLDTVGVALMGSKTKLSHIVNDFSKEFYSGEDSQSLVHHDKMSVLGALFTSAMSIDAFDMHDGQVFTKGHAGVSIIPASLLINHQNKISGKELLCNIIVGYEVALRAGMALHGSVSDYHTSGAWNSLGVCAIACKVLKLSKEQTKEALGICEFYAPRSQMMKVIDNPTMLKDGSGFGAFVGLKSAFLAKSGFTGSPSLLVESKETSRYWEDLGNEFEILKQYFKPYPVCRWAQPSIEAVNHILSLHEIDIDDIQKVTVETFSEATRLNNEIPTNTEQAQYALKYPVVLTLAKEDLTSSIIEEDFKLSPKINRLFEKVEIVQSSTFDKSFPEKRYASVDIVLDNKKISSGIHEALWGEDNPPSYEDIKNKFFNLNKNIYEIKRLNQIEQYVLHLENLDDIKKLTKLI